MSRRRQFLLWGVVGVFVFAVKLGAWLWFTDGFAPAALPEALPQELSFDDIAAAIRPSVVFIEVLDGEDDMKRVSIGTGFAVDTSGTIVTNYHVIELGKLILVHLVDEETAYPAEVVQADPSLDIAVLRVDAETFAVSLGYRLQLEAGDTIGFISGDGVECCPVPGKVLTASGYKDGQWFIHTDAPATLGHSGSPLFAMDGKVVGMISFIIQGSSGTVVSIAVTADDIKAVLAR